MGEFFKPLRRKAGCVALVLACVLVAGWLRGTTVHEKGFCPLWSGSIAWIETGDGLLELGITRTTHDLSDAHPLSKIPLWESYAPEEHSPRIQIELADRLFAVGDFGIFTRAGNYHLSIAGVEFVAFPYWSLAAPLTLLSACLLLSKPRSHTSTTTEPPPTMGA